MSGKKLTDKQEAFCQEYIKDLNVTQAAIRAGYSEKSANNNANQLMVNHGVQKRIAELKEKRNKRNEIDADWVLQQAVKLHERCMQAEPVIDREGNPTGEYKFEHAGASKSLELIGKHVSVQAFQDKVKTEVSITHEQFLDNLE